MKVTQKYVNQIAYDVVGCAIEVHKNLGPGLLESIYEKCLIEEIKEQGLKVISQLTIPIYYKSRLLDQSLKLDLLVNDLVIVELKAVELILPVFKAQLLTYLRLTQKPKGLLINFHCENIVHNLVPLVTEEFAKLDKE
ncbi:GxxExxY protein [Balneolaceae bacterium YR4-1]|uniref:GxxExxY protein n=1 Tax=Halalkalibaculum roseum TaxID=2709311 RepID=A0A6M1T581_9BACT|nr:GxxExxY protein [Halalkalibaculum roseum]NGP75493.1 GxxExxY protein [Halalkalibaculum roseum]